MTEQEVRKKLVWLREKQYALFGNDYLPSICLDVRMSLNGAADPWDKELLRETLSYLKDKLTYWQESRDVMDEAVKTMVTHAVTLIEQEL